MRFAIIVLLVSISSLVTAQSNPDRVAAVTCAVLKETRNMDAAYRVEKVNEAREQIDEVPYLLGDDLIKISIQYGTCELLVKNYPEWQTITFQTIKDQAQEAQSKAKVQAEREGESKAKIAKLIPIYTPTPRYPARAEKKGINGYATVEFTITTAGGVRDIKLVDEMPIKYGFGKSAMRAASKLKFNPRVINGVIEEVPDAQHRFTFGGFIDG